MKTLSLETVVSRRATDLQVPASSFFQHVLTHYLQDAWPLHFLVFVERLERLLQEEYLYTRESTVRRGWAEAMVRGNFWCVARYNEDPVVHLHAFFDTYRETFHDLEPAERAEDRLGGIIVNERFILPRDLREITQEKAVLPLGKACPHSSRGWRATWDTDDQKRC